MEIVINAQFGGFGLSALATQRIAELKGKKCYFFKQDRIMDKDYIPISVEEADSDRCFIFWAFSIPNPNQVLKNKKEWSEMTLKERQASNRKFEKYSLDCRDIARDDPILVKVVKELKEKSYGKHATLKIVEIPDDVDWEISEYDGNETVVEKHKSWC